ncbi:MAG: TRAP transporter small permease [Alphaproteobacteria bacterium]|nr:TRAP transporter small permease [Alphaproteobacteria bacterium]
MFSLLHVALYRLTRLIAMFGALFLMGGMLVTCADIFIRNFGNGIFGTTEMVQLSVVMLAFLAIPYTFLAEGHIAVEIFTDRWGARAQALARAFGAALGIFFMTALFWFGLIKALQKIEYGDVSMNLGIPLGFFWAPMIAGFGLSVLALLLQFTGHLAQALTGRPILPPPPGPTLPE